MYIYVGLSRIDLFFFVLYCKLNVKVIVLLSVRKAAEMSRFLTLDLVFVLVCAVYLCPDQAEPSTSERLFLPGHILRVPATFIGRSQLFTFSHACIGLSSVTGVQANTCFTLLIFSYLSGVRARRQLL